MLCEDDTDEDKTRYIALTSNSGLGYVVSFVGITVCGSLFFGIFLYFTQILSSLIIFKLQKYSVYEYKISSTKKPFIDTVSVAVKDTTHLIFEICGFYVFFSIIKTVLVSIFNIKSSTILYSFVASFLEISNGIQGASMLENTALSAFFIGFSVGFGGICMCMQTFSVCNTSLNKFKFIKIKFFQGIFCGISATIFIHFFNISKIQEITAATSAEFSFITVILNSIYLFCVLFSTKMLLYKKISN